MPTPKNKVRPPTAARSAAQRAAQVPDDEVKGDSAYARAKDAFGGKLSDEFYEYLRVHRLDDTSLCLGYYLMRASREQNLNQSDVAARTATKTLPPVTRSFLSTLLNGQTGIRADSWVRIARALDANPLEFFQAEGWIEGGDIAAYAVPNASLMLPIANKLDKIHPEYQNAAVTMVGAVLDTILIQQDNPITTKTTNSA